MVLANQDIRTEMHKSRLHVYEIAEALGIHEKSIPRMLRKELSDEKKAEIRKVIAELRDEPPKAG